MKMQETKESTELDIAIYPQIIGDANLVLNIAFHCPRGILSQRPAWQPEMHGANGVLHDCPFYMPYHEDDYIFLVSPTHEAYPFLKSQLLKHQAMSDTELMPIPAIGVTTGYDCITPIALALDLEGKVNPAVNKLIFDEDLYTRTMFWLTRIFCMNYYSLLRLLSAILKKGVLQEGSRAHESLKSNMRSLGLIDEYMNLQPNLSRTEKKAESNEQAHEMISFLQFLLPNSK